MNVTILLADLDLDELHSLWGWLNDDPRIRRFGNLKRVVSSDEREMAGAFEAISLAIGAGLSAAQLVVALLAWRESRQSRNVTILLQRGDVRTALDERDQAQIMELLTADEADGVVQPER